VNVPLALSLATRLALPAPDMASFLSVAPATGWGRGSGLVATQGGATHAELRLGRQMVSIRVAGGSLSGISVEARAGWDVVPGKAVIRFRLERAL